METLFQDVRYAFRTFAKHPGFTLIVVLSIGLGIGANTTVFTWMETLVLNPCPLVEDYKNLVAVNSANRDGIGAEAAPISYLTYVEWRDSAKSFDGMIAHTVARVNLREADEPVSEPIWGELVSGNYFDVARVPAVLGRTFTADEERNQAKVAVINYSLWRRKLGGDSSVIGKHVLVNGAEVTVIGVAPQGFNGVLAGYGYDLWLPVTLQPFLTQGANRLNNRQDRWLQGTARLKPGVTLTEANAEMRTLAAGISEAHGEVPVTGAMVKLMRERFSGPLFYPLFSALFGVTALVLLIACANVANLLLARASSRRREIGIRLALGASRNHIVRQLLVESLLLSAIGGIAGLLFALWAKDTLPLFFPRTPQAVLWKVDVNAKIIGLALAVTVVSSVIFGLIPAFRASRTDLVNAVKTEGPTTSASRSRLRDALVVAQVAMSLVALICAGLFLRSLQTAHKTDIGFSDPGHLLLMGTDFNAAHLKREEALADTDRLLDRVRGVSGVTSASVSTMVPLGFSGHSYSATRIEGYVPAQDEEVSTERVIVGDDYFETMGIPILEGRGIARQDRSDAQRVSVVNEAFVRRYYSGQGAIGKRIDQGQGWSIIVGVARDGKYRSLTESPTPLVYSSIQQWYAPTITLLVRTANKPVTLTEVMRGEFAAVNADLPFLDPRTMTEHIAASTFTQLVGASMLSSFAVLALVIAAVGLYGVLSYVVNQRTREIAIRLAVGAAPRDVIRLIVRQGLTLTLIGVSLGGGLGLAAGRILQSQLAGMSSSDPLTFVGAGMLFTGVALGACFVPARRAARVDPMVALRYQ